MLTSNKLLYKLPQINKCLPITINTALPQCIINMFTSNKLLYKLPQINKSSQITINTALSQCIINMLTNNKLLYKLPQINKSYTNQDKQSCVSGQERRMAHKFVIYRNR